MVHPLLLTSALTLALVACGGGGSSSTSGSGASAGLLLGDAPTEDLSSAILTVTEYRLLREGGAVTANLLAGPRTLDVLGLGNAASEALLDLAELGSGRYIGIQLAIDPTSVVLRDRDGLEVPVTVNSSRAIAFFDSTGAADIFLARRAYVSVSADVVLDQCLSDNGPGYDFALALRAGHGTASDAVDDFHAQVTAIDRSARWFEAEILDARRVNRDGSRVRVEVEDSDALFQFTGALFGNSNAFLASLRIGDFVEVAGALTRDGTIDATRVEIEDRSRSQVRLEGRVLAVDLVGQTFDLLLEEIEKGYSIAQPVLTALGNPGVLSFSWDAGTSWLGSRSGGGVGMPEDLVPGKKVDVRVDEADFLAPLPFAARNIRVDLDERYEGTITDRAGLPDAIELTLDNRHPGVTSGRITGPVTVDLGRDPVIFLDTGVEPWLNPNDLQTGLKIKVAGKLTGSGAGATLDPRRVEVEPGRLRGVVESVSPTEARFTVVVTELDDPFGDPEPLATVDILLPTPAVLDVPGATDDLAGLRFLFAGLAPDESLTVRLEGIGDGTGLVRAYEAEFDVEAED